MASSQVKKLNNQVVSNQGVTKLETTYSSFFTTMTKWWKADILQMWVAKRGFRALFLFSSPSTRGPWSQDEQ